MNICESDKLIIFIAFVIPGFISLKAYEVIFPGIYKDSSKQIVDAIAYSCINYALLFWLIFLIEKNNVKVGHPILYIIFYLFILFIAPIVWVLFWKFLRTLNISQKIAPHPTLKPWDFVFSKREPFWIKITLKNGQVIAGKYASKSFASSAPADEQIYLEEVWLLNEKKGFNRPKERTRGVIVLPNEISYLELFQYREKKNE